MHRPVGSHGVRPSRTEDAALVACLWLVIGLASSATLATVLRAGSASSRPAPEYVVAAFLVSLLVSGGVVVRFRERLYAALYRPAAAGDSVWADLVLFNVTCLAAVLGSAALLVAIGSAIGDVAVGELVNLLFSLGTLAVGVLIVRACRDGRLSVPRSLRSERWGLTEYGTLFGSVTLLGYVYSLSVFGSAIGLGGLVPPVLGALAVVLRALGVFVPESPATAGRGAQRARK